MKEAIFLFLLLPLFAFGQSSIDSFRMYGDVRITIDKPASLKKKETILIIYALPNGNTTEQTMGKTIKEGDDWHFDIQHIRAQTDFVRTALKKGIVVAYLENNYRSWPTWKAKHPEYVEEIQHIVDTLFELTPTKHKSIYLNGHSGGGSFIFGYLDGVKQIPRNVERISFLDSDYGYDSSYAPKFINWLKGNEKATLTVFAYNDSVALYNGKPVVSEKGGTWYRSHLMMKNLQGDSSFYQTRNDSLIFYRSSNSQV